MSITLKRIAAGFGVAAATATVLVGVSASPAMADCSGVGNPYSPFNLWIGGILRGQEAVQYASTCDGDSNYRGKVNDTYTDGYQNCIKYYDPGTTTQGCSGGSWVNFQFYDQQSNSDAYWAGCAGSTCTVRIHNWGF
ncbi:hypothetical protein [Actinoplanes ianthinogenes]|nr:hypothetical protein [Actinoplanes ianthinogenes]